MECRGNQRFDADQPHPVCDYPGQRTQGYERKLPCSPNMSSDVTLLYLMFKWSLSSGAGTAYPSGAPELTTGF